MTTARWAPHQGPPHSDLSDFPSTSLSAGPEWFRCHRNAHGAWWFASHPAGVAGGGRWDLPEPEGTCYLAESAEASLREVAGPDLLDVGFVTRTWVNDRTVSTVQLPAGVTVADLQNRQISAYGASAELMGAIAYSVTQQWAQAWRTAGFGGVRYGMRFAANLVGLGLFGTGGTPGEKWPASDPRPAGDVAESAGIRVVEIPASRDLSVIDPAG